MTTDFTDDPMLTAYILGEVDQQQRAELEARLAADPELAAYVEELRAATDLLASELGESEVVGLSDIERRQLVQQAAVQESAPLSRRRWWIAGAGSLAALAAAAVLLAQAKNDESRHSGAAGSDVAAVSDVEGQGQEQLNGSSAATATESSAARMTLEDVIAEAPESGVSVGANISTPVGGTVTLDGQSGRAAGYHGHRIALERGDEPSQQTARVKGLDWGERQPRTATGEGYDEILDNDFIKVSADPRSTFSIDVDTGSYSNIRRFLQRGQRPPKGAVRIEEMINYFDYDYEQPEQGEPFSVRSDVTAAPWNPSHRLVRISLKGRELQQRPTNNLVFLLDVSGSMNEPNKLPLLRRAMSLLVDKLGEEDRIAIVVYAGASGLVLPSTSVGEKHKILASLEKLRAGGSTNGGAGLELAYGIAIEQFIQGGNNRVILATDGDFNVGTTSRADMLELISKKAKSGVFLTVLGFGMGNYQDGMLEQIANHGNGHYAYIDTLNEARKVLVHDLDSTLVTIAKDVKIQIELNPKEVSEYRLIGYENRVMAHHEFNDDSKDAGEIGAGHRVTALYEIVPANGGTAASSTTDALKYQSGQVTTRAADSGELMSLKLRFKLPTGSVSTLREYAVLDRGKELAEASADFRFAASVAAFGMLLRDSKHKGGASYKMVSALASPGASKDPFGYRREFLGLVKRAAALER